MNRDLVVKSLRECITDENIDCQEGFIVIPNNLVFDYQNELKKYIIRAINNQLKSDGGSNHDNCMDFEKTTDYIMKQGAIIERLQKEYDSFQVGFSKLEGYCMENPNLRATIHEMFESILKEKQDG